jgi:2-isopropylmalate synthase
MAEDKVYIFDTTLRDGEQAAGAAMTIDEKVEVAKQLERLGVDIIEAGFAASSPGDFQAVQRVAREVRGPIIASLARAHPGDVDAAVEATKGARHPRVHVFLSSSDIHVMHQLHKDREQVMNMAVEAVRRARRSCEDVEFSPMDATRTQPEYLFTLLKAVIDAGATTVNIPDTVGYAIPEEFARLIRGIQEHVPNIHKARMSVHCHNDLGLAVSNTLAAVQAGVRQVEGCINGIGERAGNAALEEIIMGLHTRRDYFGMTIGVDTTQIYPTSRLVSQITGFPVQPNKAVVGLNAFRHASGIHQDGVIKERTTYEIMDPRSIGLPGSSLVLGKLSGRAGLRARLEELGYKLSQEELDRAFTAFKELADKKREVMDRDLEALMAERRRVEEAPSYQLQDAQIQTGTGRTPTASVRMIAQDGKVREQTATGNGPVDAICKAVAQAVGVQAELDEYSVQSITGGLDATADVTIRLKFQGRLYTGRGADTDTLVASARAYLNALNRLMAMEGAGSTPQVPGM